MDWQFARNVFLIVLLLLVLLHVGVYIQRGTLSPTVTTAVLGSGAAKGSKISHLTIDHPKSLKPAQAVHVKTQKMAAPAPITSCSPELPPISSIIHAHNQMASTDIDLRNVAADIVAFDNTSGVYTSAKITAQIGPTVYSLPIEEAKLYTLQVA